MIAQTKYPIQILGQVATIERNSVDPAKIPDGTKYIGLENIDSKGRVIDVLAIDKNGVKSNKYIFTSKHILYGKLRPYLKKIALPKFDGICSTDILPILPSERLCRRYLFYCLRQQHLIDKAAALSSGVNLPRLSPRRLAEFPIPLPPLAEQKRIAAILDKADALRSKRREAIAKLDTLVQSVFLEMFGDPVTNPKGWEDKYKLGELSEIVSGITKGRKLNGQTTRTVSYLAVSNVQDKYLALDTVKRIEATESEINKYRLHSNDLLLTEGGDPDKLGRGSLWANQVDECIHQNHVFRVRLTSEIVHPVFLNWIVGSARGKRYFLRSAKQTTGIASINMTQLKSFPLLIPPFDIQAQFAKYVVAYSQKKKQQLLNLTLLENLFHSLQQRAFRGEL